MTAAAPAPLGRRLVTAAIVLLVVLAVPVAGALAVGGTDGARGAAVGALFGFLIAVRAGWQRTLVAVPGLALATLAGAATAGTSGWVWLLAGIGLLAGLATSRGLLAPVAFAGMLAASVGPPGSGESLAAVVLFATAGVLYAGVVARWLGLPAQVDGVRLPLRDAVVIGLVLAAVTAIAAVLALRSGVDQAYWLPATVFVLAQPAPGLRLSEQARARVAGTVLGVVAAVVIAWVLSPPAPRLGLAVLAMLLVLAVPQPLWLNSALSTVGLVLLLDPAGDGLAVGETRVVAVVAASGLVLLGALGLTWWGRRHPAPEDERRLAEDLVRVA